MLTAQDGATPCPDGVGAVHHVGRTSQRSTVATENDRRLSTPRATARRANQRADVHVRVGDDARRHLTTVQEAARTPQTPPQTALPAPEVQHPVASHSPRRPLRDFMPGFHRFRSAAVDDFHDAAQLRRRRDRSFDGSRLCSANRSIGDEIRRKMLRVIACAAEHLQQNGLR